MLGKGPDGGPTQRHGEQSPVPGRHPRGYQGVRAEARARAPCLGAVECHPRCLHRWRARPHREPPPPTPPTTDLAGRPAPRDRPESRPHRRVPRPAGPRRCPSQSGRPAGATVRPSNRDPAAAEPAHPMQATRRPSRHSCPGTCPTCQVAQVLREAARRPAVASIRRRHRQLGVTVDAHACSLEPLDQLDVLARGRVHESRRHASRRQRGSPCLRRECGCGSCLSSGTRAGIGGRPQRESAAMPGCARSRAPCRRRRTSSAAATAHPPRCRRRWSRTTCDRRRPGSAPVRSRTPRPSPRRRCLRRPRRSARPRRYRPARRSLPSSQASSTTTVTTGTGMHSAAVVSALRQRGKCSSSLCAGTTTTTRSISAMTAN